MRMVIATSSTPEFHVSPWSATTAEEVVTALRAQLQAATVIWPELQDAEIDHVNVEENQ